jgi:hypothetical protein
MVDVKDLAGMALISRVYAVMIDTESPPVVRACRLRVVGFFRLIPLVPIRTTATPPLVATFDVRAIQEDLANVVLRRILSEEDVLARRSPAPSPF